jgi:hypothetical protein
MTAGPANGSNERSPRRRPANASLLASMARSVSVAWLSESVISDHPGRMSGLSLGNFVTIRLMEHNIKDRHLTQAIALT